MDYTSSNSYAVDAGTGQRMHMQAQATPTAVSDADLNGMIWELLALIKAAGIAPAAFDKAAPGTYTQVRDAVAVLTRLQTAAVVNAGGTADVLTANFQPAVTALSHGMILYVRATTANLTTTPTFSPNGLAPLGIRKGNGLALAAGDISGVGHWLELQYDQGWGVWALLNPAKGVSVAASGVNSDITSLSALNQVISLLAILGNIQAAGGVQFTSATSQDGFLQVDSGRTLRWRNGNAVSPNWGVVGFETGAGIFHQYVHSDGLVESGGGSTGNGSVALTPGNPSNTGYINFTGSNGLRSGYIGYTANAGSQDGGTIDYKAGAHNFFGELATYGNNPLRLGTDQAGGAVIKYNVDGNLNIIPRTGYRTIVTGQLDATQFNGALNGNATTASNALGVGQTWQNMTGVGGRAVGTNITNNSGRSIVVSIYTAASGASQWASLTVGGVLMASTLGDTTNGASASTLTAIVPNNTAYVVTGTRSISNWAELR